MRNTPLDSVCELVDYGLWGAGGDCSSMQQHWGADCIEAAIHIMKGYNISEIDRCGKKYTINDLLMEIDRMRKAAIEFEKAEK